MTHVSERALNHDEMGTGRGQVVRRATQNGISIDHDNAHGAQQLQYQRRREQS